MVPLQPKKLKLLIKIDVKMTVRQMAQLQQASQLKLDIKVTDRQMAPLLQDSTSSFTICKLLIGRWRHCCKPASQLELDLKITYRLGDWIYYP